MKLSRHESQCTVCKRPDRGLIEEKYINWQSRIRLEEEYGLPRDSLYRHAKALGLDDRRQSNLIGALETIIERGLNTDLRVTATNVIEAIKVHAKLTGQWVDLTGDIRREFEGKSTEEIRHYADTGRWPSPHEPTQPLSTTACGQSAPGCGSSAASCTPLL